jgi:hypothetical protein
MLNNKMNLDETLDEVLVTDPGYTLPDGFAERISVMVKKRTEAGQMLKDFVIYIAIFLVVSIIAGTFGYFMKLSIFEKFSSLIAGNLLWVAGTILILLFVLFADKVVLPYVFLARTLKK